MKLEKIEPVFNCKKYIGISEQLKATADKPFIMDEFHKDIDAGYYNKTMTLNGRQEPVNKIIMFYLSDKNLSDVYLITNLIAPNKRFTLDENGKIMFTEPSASTESEGILLYSTNDNFKATKEYLQELYDIAAQL